MQRKAFSARVERGVDPPHFFGRKILTVGAQQVAAIETRRHPRFSSSGSFLSCRVFASKVSE